MSRHRHHRIRWRSIFLWHRYLGLASATFVALLAITGLLLNHTEALKLDRQHVQAEWLMDWYGIATPDNFVGFMAAGHHVTQVGERLYFNRTEIASDTGPLIGAIAVQDMIVVATPDQLLLLTPGGELIERLGRAQGAPADMEALGRTGDRLLVRAARGVFVSDTMLLEWREHPEGRSAHWAAPARTPDGLRQDLINRYRGSGLTRERVILDLHSGRILGRAGVYLMDAAAIAFIALAVLGIWVWASRQRK